MQFLLNYFIPSWWRHQMEAFSALLVLCAGNSPITGEYPSQRPVTRSFDVYFYLRLNKRLSKQSWVWWFETPLRSLWCHCNDYTANGPGNRRVGVHVTGVEIDTMCIPDRLSVVQCSHGHVIGVAFFGAISVAWSVRAGQLAAGGVASVWRSWVRSPPGPR